jgi:hypothetical protein
MLLLTTPSRSSKGPFFKRSAISMVRSHSPSQISRLLWNLEVHYRDYRNPPLVPILNQLDLVYILQRSILILHSHLRLGLPSGVFPLFFRSEFCLHFTYFQCMLYAPHLILFDLITLIVRGCIQKFPDWVDNEINTRWEATQMVTAA